MKYLIAASLLLFISSCRAQGLSHNSVQNSEQGVLAFPGAEGFGKFTKGGRGGEVLVVSNLNDQGPGSFREAAQKNFPRIIVFAISGTIHLTTRLAIKGDVTIAGQTAPGDGICLADQPVSLGGNNMIIRFLRFRMGDKYQNTGMVDGAGGDDAFGGTGRKNIMIDHCSMSWSTDEVFSVYNGDSTTLQWNIITEPLNYSYHFETGDKDFEHHGYGGIWGGRHLTAHHNLFAHCLSRNPRFAGIRNVDAELADFTNNVIYDWGHNNVYGGEGGLYNITANYYRPGPITVKAVRSRIVNPSKQAKPFINFGKYYVADNYMEDAPDVSADNWLGVHMPDASPAEKEAAKASTPFSVISISTQTPKEAYQQVLATGGASLPKRDTMDQRIINDVKTRAGRSIDVQGGYPHGTPYERSQSAWPALASIAPPSDSDKDGMPDAWEKKMGLDPQSKTDAAGYKLDKWITNIEVFLNSIVADAKKN